MSLKPTVTVPDLETCRSLVARRRPNDLGNHPKRSDMAPLAHAMLDDALTMGHATGSIGSTHIETVGGYEFAVSYVVRPEGEVHDVCKASPATACVLCRDDIKFPRRR